MLSFLEMVVTLTTHTQFRYEFLTIDTGHAIGRVFAIMTHLAIVINIFIGAV